MEKTIDRVLPKENNNIFSMDKNENIGRIKEFQELYQITKNGVNVEIVLILYSLM